MYWSFFGRDDDVRFVRETLADEQRGGVLVRSDPGMGRSRLVAESLWFLDERRYALLPMLPGRAGGPLSTLRHCIAQYVDDVSALELAGMPAEPVAARLAAACGARRPVLAMDDVHLMDEESLRVAAALVRHNGAVAVATLPAYALLPGPLRPLVTAGALHRRELRPLRADDVRRMLLATLGSGIPEPAVRRLHRASQGNPRTLGRLIVEAGEPCLTKAGPRREPPCARPECPRRWGSATGPGEPDGDRPDPGRDFRRRPDPEPTGAWVVAAPCPADAARLAERLVG